MSQTIFANINPSTTSGNQLATLLNDFKDAVASGFSGATRPANLQAGGYWIDTAQAASPDFLWKMKVWTGTVDIEVFRLNISTNTVSVAGTTGDFTISQTSDDAIGPILSLVKKRISGSNGQSLVNDVLGEVSFKSTTDTGSNIISARIKSVALNNATSSQTGAYLVFEEIDLNSGTLTEKMRLLSGKLGIGTINPSHALHVKSLTGIKHELEEDSTTSSKIVLKKKRVSGSGQVLNNDGISSLEAVSMDQLGSELTAFQLDVTATEDHTDTAHGSKASFKIKPIGSIVATEVLSLTGTLVSTAIALQAKSSTIGSSGTAASNVKLNRAGAGKVQAVLGNDATAEASEATTLAQFGFVAENYLNASKPTNATANKGRIIYVTDTNKFEYDTGAAWAGLGGGALVVSSQLTLTSAAAIAFSGTTSRRLIKVQSNSGEQDLSALSPQVQAGVDEGQELILVGQSDTAYIILKNGNGLKLNGDWIGTNQSVLSLVWVGSTWVEVARS